jgi:hypothetical protein
MSSAAPPSCVTLKPGWSWGPHHHGLWRWTNSRWHESWTLMVSQQCQLTLKICHRAPSDIAPHRYNGQRRRLIARPCMTVGGVPCSFPFRWPTRTSRDLRVFDRLSARWPREDCRCVALVTDSVRTSRRTQIDTLIVPGAFLMDDVTPRPRFGPLGWQEDRHMWASVLCMLWQRPACRGWSAGWTACRDPLEARTVAGYAVSASRCGAQRDTCA